MKISHKQVVFAIVLLGLLIRGVLLPMPGNWFDLDLFKYWSLHTGHYGFDNMEVLPGSPLVFFPIYALYLPVLRVLGALWLHLYPSDGGILTFGNAQVYVFSQSMFSWIGTVVMKLPALMADFAIGFVIYRFVRKRFGDRRAVMALALALLNPATIYDTAYWGQIDSIHSLAILLAYLAIFWKQPLLSALMMGTAVFLKPQSIAFAPVWLMILFARFPWQRVARDGLMALGIVVAALALIFIHEPKKYLLGGVALLANAYPYLAVGAVNIWAPIQAEAHGFMRDTGTVSGVSPKAAGLGLFVLALVATLVFLRKHKKNNEAVLWAAVVSGMAFFLFPTEMHERYLYPIFPFLALLVAMRPRAIWLWAALSLAFLGNLLIILPFLGLWQETLFPSGPLMYTILTIYLVCFFRILFSVRSAGVYPLRSTQGTSRPTGDDPQGHPWATTDV